MADVWIIVGVFISLLQVGLVGIYTIYMGLQLRCMKEQTQQLTEQTRQLKETQEGMIAHGKREKSFDYVKRWNSKEIVDIRHEAISALQKCGQSGDDEQHTMLAYLNFFEEMAMAVLSEIADEGTCYVFFRLPFLCAYTAFEKAFNDNPGGFSYSHKLYLKWRFDYNMYGTYSRLEKPTYSHSKLK